MINFFVLNVKHPDHYSRTKSIAEQEVLRANGLSLQGREFLFCPFVNISSSSSYSSSSSSSSPPPLPPSPSSSLSSSSCKKSVIELFYLHHFYSVLQGNFEHYSSATKCN